MQYTLKKVFNFITVKDILHLFIALFILPWALMAKIFVRDFWLICEDRNEARDNGYWFFKWIRENRPKQKVAYAINKKSCDYDKVKDLGRIIQYGSISHWFWYIVADKNISSQKGGKPNAAVCYLFEVVFGMRKNNRVFLQHGVTINKGDWLFYKNTKLRLFITAAQPEHDFILDNFGYPKGNVKMCGFTRFDALHGIEVDKDLILVMPSWRNWLGRASRDNKHSEFTESEYFLRWNEFLNDSDLINILEQNHKRLLFFPHRNMQKFIGAFSTKSNNIEIAGSEKYDIQDILKRAGFMITDYSSVLFDFAYMCKPVVFYQFDEKEFREKQYGEGFFDYHNSVLGIWTDTLPEVVKQIELYATGKIDNVEEEHIKKFFSLWDTDNCLRTYNCIKDL